MVLSFPRYSHDVAWTLWIELFEFVPRLSASCFPETFYLEKRVRPNLVIPNPNCDTILTIAIAFLSSFSLLFWNSSSSLSFCLVVHQTHYAGTYTYHRLWKPVSFWMNLTLGRMPIFTKLSRAFTLHLKSTPLSKNGSMVTFASDTSLLRHTSTSWYGWLRKCGGRVFWLLRAILGFLAETAMVSLRTLAFFFPLVTDTFSSFNAWQSLSTLYHCSCFHFPMPGKVS